MNVPRWTGETLVTPTQPVTGTEPLNLSLISFDANGQANVAGIPAETLAGLGVAVPQLTPDQMNLIKAIGLDKLTITSTPNGIDLVANGDQPWPSLAYDEQRLQSLSGLLGAVLPAEQATMVQGILPMLPKLGMNFTVGFNGQPPETIPQGHRREGRRNRRSQCVRPRRAWRHHASRDPEDAAIGEHPAGRPERHH